ncbi:NADH-quinone oxidoreductase subunit L [Usitatibacter palustris]|uniref:NADH-quinone oxidoreductase subunit L n=1 Tax=Usitatibacter palustris TaxID=2732487 RepID=A0A6M4HBS8_9PROT|nr:NADH-quinone oxidoreductase subunit L [Usitatibacter palustris]QJR16073.1 NADH-quinone oxidoreductase subunit L [Usitatibacter palustris]
MDLMTLSQIAAFAPLVGAILAGFLGWKLGRSFSHWVTIVSVLVSLIASLVAFQQVMDGGRLNATLYTWAAGEGWSLQVGFLIDPLTVTMMTVVTFVSLMVHVYTIGYMAEDPGYQRFFCYISLFTFSMMMLVMANNFLQLFFGWEAVGLVSYLLIGFWFTRPTAIYANLKAFLVNRVGDFGFLMGIAIIFMIFGTLDYQPVFEGARKFAGAQLSIIPGVQWSALTIICIGLFIGAMGKSAQFPLHVWLPDSMEGPTPISALIHAATMVTAGIFMVARMSPLFELSQTALTFVVIIGSITAFFMALIAIVQTDIKRVVAYSTLSQLGYMTMALGAGAYSVGIFHLMTHAFFKAVLFLGAGSVIIAMHHEQDMRRMGGLRKYMPITYFTVLIGALANAGLPPFAGFFSKDSIIEALHLSTTPGAHFAYWLAMAGVFVGGLYSFRLVFFAFHGKERFREVQHEHGGHGGHGEHHEVHEPHESPWVVTVPLVLLAIPSVVIGWLAIGPMLYGGYFAESIMKTATMAEMAKHFHGAGAMVVHALTTLPFWLAVAGAGTAYYLYILRPDLPAVIKAKSGVLATILERKYGFDDFNDWFFAGGARKLGGAFWQWGDRTVIDGIMVNGTARLIGWTAGIVRQVQTGYVYHYAFTMIIGVFVLLTLWYWKDKLL